MTPTATRPRIRFQPVTRKWITQTPPYWNFPTPMYTTWDSWEYALRWAFGFCIARAAQNPVVSCYTGPLPKLTKAPQTPDCNDADTIVPLLAASI